MKKKNNKMRKISAILTTALLAASATGISTSAQGVKALESANNKTVKTSTKTNRKEAMVTEDGTAFENTISLGNAQVNAGETAEVPMIFNTNNQATCYDLVVEYDSRLDLVDVTGVQAFSTGEQDGRKFVSLVGWTTSKFEDGVPVAVLKFNIPENAENDKYDVRFSQITSFSDEVADFEDYTAINGSVSVTGGVDVQKQNAIELKSLTALAGGSAVVQMIPYAYNKATCYDVVLEYDSRLTLEESDISNVQSACIYEQDGKSYVSLVGFTSDIYTDGNAMATLNFHVPADASVDDVFEVKFNTVNSFASSDGDFEGIEIYDAAITVVGTESTNDNLTSHKTFMKYSANGTLLGSVVGVRGDANGDGKANIRDAAAVASYLAKKHTGGATMSDENQFFGDVDDNETLNIRDASKIARFAAKGGVDWNA